MCAVTTIHNVMIFKIRAVHPFPITMKRIKMLKQRLLDVQPVNLTIYNITVRLN